MSDIDEMNENWIETMRAQYNPPPETPREAMWAEIEARLDESASGSDVIPIGTGKSGRGTADSGGRAGERRRMDEQHRRTGGHPRWMVRLAAAAVLILIGVGLGRMSVPDDPAAAGTMAAGEDTRGSSPTFQRAAYRHLSRSESFLAMVRTDARQGSLDEELGRWSRGLLLQTRLLMDSPAAQDPAMRRLLQDLELILAQVAQVESERPSGGVASGELALLSEALEKQNMIMRIRSVLPIEAAQAGL